MVCAYAKSLETTARDSGHVSRHRIMRNIAKGHLAVSWAHFPIMHGVYTTDVINSSSTLRDYRRLFLLSWDWVSYQPPGNPRQWSEGHPQVLHTQNIEVVRVRQDWIRAQKQLYQRRARESSSDHPQDAELNAIRSALIKLDRDVAAGIVVPGWQPTTEAGEVIPLLGPGMLSQLSRLTTIVEPIQGKIQDPLEVDNEHKN